ncbi:MAG TPA: hypothetical protein VFX92_07735 [Candidatus Krumholzibacteria bacterium]|nr:hypothetical protein [Candidatus Krumholzibacteria bacterium]
MAIAAMARLARGAPHRAASVSVSQSTVAKYMRRQRRPPSQTWRTCLTNHASQIMAADLFVVPTVTFRLLFVLVILAHDRRVLDHVIVMNAAGLRRVLTDYVAYYMRSRTHLALYKDTPCPRPVTPPSAGRIVAISEVGGLHHRYDRIAA